MSNLSWLLYCVCSMLYVNALLTNMCYQKLRFIEQLCIFLYSTVLYYVLASRYNLAIIPILIVSIYLYIIVKQKHPLINAIGMGMNYILGVLINYVILAILYAMKLSIESISSNLGYMAIFCIIQTIIMYIATGTAGYFFRKLLVPHFKTHSPKRYSTKIICLLTAEILICCGVFLFNVIYGNYVGYNAATLIFNGVLFFILSLSSGLILFFLHRTMTEDYQLRLQVQEMQYIKEYSQKLEELYKEVRSFKHNYINILSSMYSYLDEQRYEELKDYFEQIVLPQGRNLASEDSAFGQLQNIQISEIKGIISIKLMSAASKQLHIRSEIPAPVPNLEMDTQDLIKILGIYLDNAIEAAEQTVEKELSLSITCNPDICILQITNSSLPVENIPILFTAEYSAKENHTGIGLYDASRILGHYEHILSNTEYKNGIFTQVLQIPIQK